MNYQIDPKHIDEIKTALEMLFICYPKNDDGSARKPLTAEESARIVEKVLSELMHKGYVVAPDPGGP